MSFGRRWQRKPLHQQKKSWETTIQANALVRVDGGSAVSRTADMAGRRAVAVDTRGDAQMRSLPQAVSVALGLRRRQGPGPAPPPPRHTQLRGRKQRRVVHRNCGHHPISSFPGETKLSWTPWISGIVPCFDNMCPTWGGSLVQLGMSTPRWVLGPHSCLRAWGSS